MIKEGDTFGDSTPALKYNLDSLSRNLGNHLGSSNVLVDEYGTLVNFEEYYPFGETSFGSYAKKRYRFCGKEKDDESGMYYYGARYYSPWLCRFISVDPLAGKYVFQSPYVYADDNPINKMDYNGEGTEGAPSGGGGVVSNLQTGEFRKGRDDPGEIIKIPLAPPGGDIKTNMVNLGGSEPQYKSSGKLTFDKSIPKEAQTVFNNTDAGKRIRREIESKGTHDIIVFSASGGAFSKESVNGMTTEAKVDDIKSFLNALKIDPAKAAQTDFGKTLSQGYGMTTYSSDFVNSLQASVDAGKNVILVGISSKLINDASAQFNAGQQSLKMAELAFTILHETFLHALGSINGDQRGQVKQHQEFYGEDWKSQTVLNNGQVTESDIGSPHFVDIPYQINPTTTARSFKNQVLRSASNLQLKLGYRKH